ncbi:TPA: thioesterase [Candidatus Bathyarchaeota archaeon]|nr:thioesterase [Candidatus Bathyarchaeota archaeon]
MDIRTHVKISERLVGRPLEVTAGERAVVELVATAEMEADALGLTHGGFTFGLADYAAMLAVNHPNVVLGSAQTRFIAPVKTGDTMRAEATVTNVDGKKSEVNVEVKVGERKVFTGTFQCYSLEKHVLEKS